jgi:hypothetical protein
MQSGIMPDIVVLKNDAGASERLLLFSNDASALEQL